MAILSAQYWPTNGHLIADVSKLGYLGGSVLDVTFGLGVFWSQWQPKKLIGCDLNPEKSPIGYAVDFTNLPFEDGSFDAVVFDPPYKLNGTPTDEADERYGVEVPTRWKDRFELMGDGLSECIRVSRRYILFKCMDQVVSGHKRWQTFEFATRAIEEGCLLADRFDMLVTPRPQPPGRRQVHSQGNYSTLLVFEK